MKAFLSIVFSLLGYAVALAQSIGDFQSVVEVRHLEQHADYSQSDADVEQSTTRALIGIYTMSGMKVNAPVKGVNIYKYSDGTTKKVLVDN